ncbi:MULTISPECIES: DNA polymerase III subunit delta [Cytobacillus]|uniref:DNA polymerase III subunit delta n=1 Tax=Cytobacillus kochii TaxID=859143 RepID=A0A248TLB6_9BACI|nr:MULTISPECIES: DNA polymerase III subunit delta [Cytobacillus]ASV68935.1 DNA polymerase III subunit delta [Cytobacillus kochii]MCA1025414.1 DNA polymerase III subunit delta [Cytobacillus kochii]MCM3324610.1 DNA polymerase III subunit delta [Cytobacillus kochii]MCM3347003.1 DNA polymerase III subunit delta [Cytobacillus kochii]MDM5208539.1 DNA polymerase III subunit delta [Cytobacillus kochii]
MVFDIWKQIKAKSFSSVYLLYGTEPYLINETKQLLINHALLPEELDFNLSTYDLEETPIEVALEDAETFPFMGERRLIILHNPYFLTADKGKAKVEHQLNALENYLKDPAPYTILVFSGAYEKLDERKKLTKQIKKSAAVLEAKQLNEKELHVWMRDRASKNGVQIDEEAINLLLTLSGMNLFMLTSEMDKLALYGSDERRITVEMVDQLVSRSLEQNIFTLVEKVVHRDIEAALRIFYDLLKLNEEPIKILAVITNQFRLIYQVKELSRRGYGQNQIAGYIKTHPFRVKLAAGQARLFSEEELSQIMDILADADYQMKTGGMNKQLLIELFLFKLNKRDMEVL